MIVLSQFIRVDTMDLSFRLPNRFAIHTNAHPLFRLHGVQHTNRTRTIKTSLSSCCSVMMDISLLFSPALVDCCVVQLRIRFCFHLIAVGFHDTISPNNCTAMKATSLSAAKPSMVSRPSRLIVAFILVGLAALFIVVVPVHFVSGFVRCGP